MDTKLTLKLDNAYIEKAKKYATKRRTSLSSLVEKYFAFLTDLDISNDIKISPTVKKLTGVINLESDFDIKHEKTKRLLERYK
jgi:hypothetical protein